MGWEAVSNMALIGLLVLLAAGITYTLSGLDKWLDDRRNRRDHDRFDVFTDGRWHK